MNQMNYLGEFVQMDEKEYLWYKLCIYYHAQTELFDRTLTDLRSPYDPTEAYIDGRVRSYSNAYALRMRKFVYSIAKELDIPIKYAGLNAAQFRFSAQGFINEYNRLAELGEMDFINTTYSG